ncbi:MAG TPA: hypothetical protein VNT30_10475 [Stellaceae bacterium]|nr:hypothetical protein [Stellaceae bacterium]
MAGWYRTGTVSLTNGSAAVTGSGTNWQTQGVQPGDVFTIDNLTLYEVLSVNSQTSLTLNGTYAGTTATAAAYAIIQNLSTLTGTLSAQISTLIAAYQSAQSATQAGKFTDGTVAAPGAAFAAQTTTGLYRRTSDGRPAMAASGAEVAVFDPAGTRLTAAPTVAGLRAFTGTGNEMVTASGFASTGDGGGSPFFWVPTSLAADDGAITLLPTGYGAANPGRWVRDPSIAKFDIRKFGALDNGLASSEAVNYAAFTLALQEIATRGGGVLYVPPPAVSWRMTAGAGQLYVPSNTLVAGEPGASLIQLDYSTIPTNGKVSLFATGNPLTAVGSGTVTGFAATGTGATFTCTFTSGVLTGAAVASGGGGYKPSNAYYKGDLITLAGGTFTTAAVLQVTGTSAWRGAITAVSIYNPGAGYSVNPTNPVSQTSALGQYPADYIYNKATIADNVHFYGLVLDGGALGGAALTSTQSSSGINLGTVLRASASYCEARYFANTGFASLYATELTYLKCSAHHNGLTAAAGQDRNGFDLNGFYNTTNPELNNRSAHILGCVASYNNDCNYTWSMGRGSIIGNESYGSGLGIEAQAQSFGTLDTKALTGIEVPGKMIIAHNLIDGLNEARTAIIGNDALTLNSGNESDFKVEGNVVRNWNGWGISCGQSNGASLELRNNKFETIGQANSNVAGVTARVDHFTSIGDRWLTIGNSGNQTQGVYQLLSPYTTVLIDDYEIDTVQGKGIGLGAFVGATRSIKIGKGVFNNVYFGAIELSASTGPWTCISMEINGAEFINCNRYGDAYNHCPIVMSDGGTARIAIDSLRIVNCMTYESPAKSQFMFRPALVAGSINRMTWGANDIGKGGVNILDTQGRIADGAPWTQLTTLPCNSDGLRVSYAGLGGGAPTTGYNALGDTCWSPRADTQATALYRCKRAGQNAPSWAASTAYAAGTQAVPTADNGFYYAATVAGTSGTAAPTWPTTIGNTVTDGTVTWTCTGAASLWRTGA